MKLDKYHAKMKSNKLSKTKSRALNPALNIFFSLIAINYAYDLLSRRKIKTLMNLYSLGLGSSVSLRCRHGGGYRHVKKVPSPPQKFCVPPMLFGKI